MKNRNNITSILQKNEYERKYIRNMKIDVSPTRRAASEREMNKGASQMIFVISSKTTLQKPNSRNIFDNLDDLGETIQKC